MACRSFVSQTARINEAGYDGIAVVVAIPKASSTKKMNDEKQEHARVRNRKSYYVTF